MSPVEEREAARRHLVWLEWLGCQPEAIDEFLGLTAGVTRLVMQDHRPTANGEGEPRG